MKTLYRTLFFILMWTSTMTFAQCPIGNVNLFTQADVDAFVAQYPNCTEINGDLCLGDCDEQWWDNPSNISNVSGLNYIQSIAGRFTLANLDFLEDFSGLSNITYIGGHIAAVGNEKLIDFMFLQNLSGDLNGGISAYENTSLLSFKGFSNVISFGREIWIDKNPNLTSLIGFEKLYKARYIVLQGNESLRNVDGLSGLTVLFEAGLTITHNLSLQNLNGFLNLREINGKLLIAYNQNLVSITGLSSIDPNSIITPYETSDLSISYNPNLSECSIENLCSILNLEDDRTIEITQNGVGCRSMEDVKNNCIPPEQNLDYRALETFYNSTNGDNWINNTNWLSDKPISEWYGVSTDINDRVTGIELYLNNLSGTIPSSLSQVEFLNVLNLGNNKLKGGIPAELSGLSNLKTLRLEQNELEGNISVEFGSFNNLSHLILSDNLLVGEIPASLGNIESLETLELNRNKLTGFIPFELTFATNLRKLNLNSNLLSGEIPIYLQEFKKLESLHLGGNDFVNSIPPEIGNISTLKLLYITNTQVTGLIPEELGQLTNLEYFYLSSNNLEGEIPSTFGNLINLKQLGLYKNNLEGEIPDEIKNMIQLQELHFFNNDFSGVIPDFTELTNLYRLTIENNNYQFGDLEPNFVEFNNLDFSYAPQKQISEDQDILINASETLTIEAICTGTQNNYQWFLNGGPLSGETSPSLTIQNINIENAGDYHCVVTNDIVTGFGLETGKFRVEVNNGESPDKKVLVAIYNFLIGDNWINNTNWLTDKPINEWYGVDVNEDNRVVSLDLSENNLVGNFPANLFQQLTELEGLELENNHISGIVPGLSNSKLEYFNIKLNNLYFKDIQAAYNFYLPRTVYFVYSPMNTFGEAYNINAISRETVNIPVVFDDPGFNASIYNQYQWYKDGVGLIGKTDPSLTVPIIKKSDEGEYILKVSNSLVKDLIIEKEPVTIAASSQVGTTDDSLFSLSPNPASEFIIVRFSKPATNSVFTIYNMQGHEVLRTTMKLSTSGGMIYLTSLKPGIYIMNVSNSNGVESQKLIKKR